MTTTMAAAAAAAMAVVVIAVTTHMIVFKNTFLSSEQRIENDSMELVCFR